MSDAEKPKPESLSEAIAGVADAPAAAASNVISIETARQELLRKPKRNITPPRGMTPRARTRQREVPSPVTLEPGEHDSVIVTDTPAARTHVEKRTVHPGEMPSLTHEKKVRVKTSIDPRRQKTLMTDRRVAEQQQQPAPPPADEAVVSSRGRVGPQSVAPQSVPPPSVRQSRPSIGRPRPLPRQSKAAPLFAAGIAIAAALGAVLVYTLTRPKVEPAPIAMTAPPPHTAAASLRAITAAPAVTSAPAVTDAAATATSATATAAPSELPAATATEVPAVSTAAPPVTAPRAVKTSTAALPTSKSSGPALAPTASAKPIATTVLPFGKEEN